MTRIIDQTGKKSQYPTGKTAAHHVDYLRVMDIYQIRRERLNELLHRDFGGKQIDLAVALGVSPGYISRALSKNPNSKKALGEKFARSVETKLGLAKGWMDAFMGAQAPFLTPAGIEFALKFESLPEEQRHVVEAMLRAFSQTSEHPPGDAALTASEKKRH
jgi:hypothetical protein